MAQYATTVPGQLEAVLDHITENMSRLGATVTLEEELSGTADGMPYWMGTFERYAILGENRVSLSIVLMELAEGVRVLATASGGSQAVLFKLNFWSEDNFLDDFIRVIEDYGEL